MPPGGEMGERITPQDLSQRSQDILDVLVRLYIQSGQPVGSKALAEVCGLHISPATVRNVMAELEAMGLLRSPHTSAGRVPTAQAYRLFVDTMITMREVDPRDTRTLEHALARAVNAQGLVSSVSDFLSGITKLTGIVTLPRLQDLKLRHVEFVPLSGTQVLAILVTDEREVQNRILDLPRRYSVSELQQVAATLNEQFAGRAISEVRGELLREMRAAQESMSQRMREAVELAESLFRPAEDEEAYIVAGQTNLMEFDELADVRKLRQLFEAFSHKRDLLHLLDQCLNADGVQIFIGNEAGYAVLDDCSVVTAAYSRDGKAVGVLGVIGPTRMPYERVIPAVDISARLLGHALNSRN